MESALQGREQLADVSPGQFALVWRRFRRNRQAVLGVVVLALMALAILVVPGFLPFTSTQPNFDLIFAPLGTVDQAGNLHVLGTDNLTRDELARLLDGGRVSLTIAVLSTVVIVIVGCVVGIVSGFYGGWVDTVLMRITDALLALPVLPMYVFLLRLITITVRPDHIDVRDEAAKLGLVFVILGWTAIARLVRGSVLAVRSRPFVEAARALGASDVRILFKHLLPNVAGPVIVMATFIVGDVIVWESVLSYLGMGIAIDIAPTWGNLIAWNENFIVTPSLEGLNPFHDIRLFLFIFPVFAVFLTVLSFNYIGEALRRALDPLSS